MPGGAHVYTPVGMAPHDICMAPSVVLQKVCVCSVCVCRFPSELKPDHKRLLRSVPVFQCACCATFMAQRRRIEIRNAFRRTYAETAALQLMSLEAHANPGSRTSGERGGLWAVLDAWSKEAAGAGKLPQLLRSYAHVAPRGVDALDSLFRAACAAAMDLLSDVISGAMSLPNSHRILPEHVLLASPGCSGAATCNLACAALITQLPLRKSYCEASRFSRGISGFVQHVALVG